MLVSRRRNHITITAMQCNWLLLLLACWRKKKGSSAGRKRRGRGRGGNHGRRPHVLYVYTTRQQAGEIVLELQLEVWNWEFSNSHGLTAVFFSRTDVTPFLLLS